jgi:acyl-CoA thioesterase FadM
MSIERSELTVRVYYEDTDFSGRVYHPKIGS